MFTRMRENQEWGVGQGVVGFITGQMGNSLYAVDRGMLTLLFYEDPYIASPPFLKFCLPFTPTALPFHL